MTFKPYDPETESSDQFAARMRGHTSRIAFDHTGDDDSVGEAPAKASPEETPPDIRKDPRAYAAFMSRKCGGARVDSTSPVARADAKSRRQIDPRSIGVSEEAVRHFGVTVEARNDADLGAASPLDMSRLRRG